MVLGVTVGVKMGDFDQKVAQNQVSYVIRAYVLKLKP